MNEMSLIDVLTYFELMAKQRLAKNYFDHKSLHNFTVHNLKRVAFLLNKAKIKYRGSSTYDVDPFLKRGVTRISVQVGT